MYVSGDHWLNNEEIALKLQSIPPGENVEFDFCAEGPGLRALGILDMLEAWCQKTNRDPKTVFLTHWSNDIESVPYIRSSRCTISHFFWLSERYITDVKKSTHERRFGMFVGRRTASRMKMLWDMYRYHSNQCLLSLMPSHPRYDPSNPLPGRSLDTTEEWISAQDMVAFREWCQVPPVVSLDGHWVRDQYDPKHNTNRDLLTHYHRFDIEIVMETHARGECFFPTEKTVRPLTAGKSLLVYGPKNFLARLRDLGFRTWHDYWDESYDLLEGPDRWNAMQSVVSRVAEIDLPADLESISLHNIMNLRRIMQKYRPG